MMIAFMHKIDKIITIHGWHVGKADQDQACRVRNSWKMHETLCIMYFSLMSFEALHRLAKSTSLTSVG
jgi:hypothetical protein